MEDKSNNSKQIPDGFLKEFVRGFSFGDVKKAADALADRPDALRHYQDEGDPAHYHKQKDFRKDLLDYLNSDSEARAQFCDAAMLAERLAVREERRQARERGKALRESIQPYVRWVEENSEYLAGKTDALLESRKKELMRFVLDWVRGGISEGPLPHYRWVRGSDRDHDCSGDIREDGTVDLSQTVERFLGKELTGNRRASHCPGCGWFFDTWGDNLSEDTFGWGTETMCEAVREAVGKEFGVVLTDEQTEALRDECDCFDAVLSDSAAGRFFSWEGAWEFIGSPDVTLRQLLDAGGDYVSTRL